MFRGITRVVGIIFIIYYLFLCVFTGFGVWFNAVWLMAGIIFVGASFLDAVWFKRAFCIVIAAGLIFTGIFMVPIVKASVSEPEAGAEYIVVLGAEVNPDNRPSGILKHRLDAAYDYYGQNHDAIFIVTGCQGYNENISEARCMNDWLVDKGISQDQIIMDEKAENTYQNIENAKNIIGDESKLTAIVTSDFHIYRAMRLARNQGYENITGIPAFTRKTLLPNYYLREVAAVIKDFYL